MYGLFDEGGYVRVAAVAAVAAGTQVADSVAVADVVVSKAVGTRTQVACSASAVVAVVGEKSNHVLLPLVQGRERRSVGEFIEVC